MKYHSYRHRDNHSITPYRKLNHEKNELPGTRLKQYPRCICFQTVTG